MRIHGLCIVKDEADILRQGLRAARVWCDAVYVFDNGSTDGTWELVQDLALEDPAIVPWKQSEVPFHDGLRAEIYHAFADRARPGDWWVRLDPDEFYVEDPRAFLARVSPSESCVWYASLCYYFSTEEVRRYNADPTQFDDDVPITDKCRHYFNSWSEIRFVRHEAMQPWKGIKGWPEEIASRARSHPRRILCRHFPYRSPSQIERRIAIRAPAALSRATFRHEAIRDWRASVEQIVRQERRWPDVPFATHPAELEWGWQSRVLDARHLIFDAHDGRFVVNEHLMPPIPRTIRQRLVSNRFTRSLYRHFGRFFGACTTR